MDIKITRIKTIFLHKLAGVFICIAALGLFTCSGDLLEGVENIETADTDSISVSALSVATTDTTATITWTTNVETTDQVVYGTTAGQLTSTSVATTTPTVTHSVTLSNLTTDTVYYYQVRNIHAAYGETTTTEDTFNTAYPTVTVSGASSSVTTTSATITWTTNLDTTHAIIYGTTSGSLSASTAPSTTASAAHSVTISGLTAGTTYYYQIINYHSRYADTTSAEMTLTTETVTESSPTSAQKLRGIWVLGGLSGSSIANVVAQVDLYDPITNTWYSSVTSVPTPVSFAAVCSYDGKIYVIGGFDSSGVVRTNIQEYTVSTNAWADKNTSGFVAKANIYAAVANGKIIVMGGTTVNANVAWGVVVAASTQVYDIATDTWLYNNQNGIAASEKVLLSYDGIVYNFGGRTSATATSAVLDAFVYVSNSLTTNVEIPFTTARTGLAGALYAKSAGSIFIYSVGGISAFTGTPTSFAFNGAATCTLQPLFQYVSSPIPTAGNWNTGTPLGTATAFGAAAVSGTTLYFIGGTSTCPTGVGLTTMYSMSIDPLGSSWSSKATMPIGRFGHSATVINQ